MSLNHSFKDGDRVLFNKNIIEYNMDRMFVIENVYGEFVSLREIPNMKFHYSAIESLNKFKYGDVVTDNGYRYMIIGEGSWNGHLRQYLYDIININTNVVYKGQNLSVYKLDTIRTILHGSTVYYDGYPYVANGNSYFEYNGTVREMVKLQLRDKLTIFKEVVVSVRYVTPV